MVMDGWDGDRVGAGVGRVVFGNVGVWVGYGW